MMSGVCGMKAEACEMKRPGKDAPIGVFDSGVGGISVLRKMISLMPNENYIYYGDSANAPYGDRSDEEVLSLTENVFDYLLSEGVKGIVVACNTATSVAVRRLRGRYPDLPIVGIEPAIKPAAKNHEGGRIVVMATSVTLRRPKFAHLMESFRQSAEIISMACPSIVDFVEKDKMNSQELMNYLTKKFAALGDRPADAVVLGCTHYPLIEKVIREYMGDDVTLINSGAEVAKYLKKKLTKENLLHDGKCDENQYRYYVSDDISSFEELGGIFLEREINGQVNKIDIEKY